MKYKLVGLLSMFLSYDHFQVFMIMISGENSQWEGIKIIKHNEDRLDKNKNSAQLIKKEVGKVKKIDITYQSPKNSTEVNQRIMYSRSKTSPLWYNRNEGD